MQKLRLDELLLERGLVETRAKARGLIMAGQVRVAGQIADKAGTKVGADADVQITSGMRFVSRGGVKLEAAFQHMRLDVKGLVCADVGASTGGFTDCMLQRGAERVYAIDVGKGVLHWKMRNDPRVVLMEETNARNLLSLTEHVELVTIDASFISLRLLLPSSVRWLQPNSGSILALIKPQFEAGRAQVGKGGVVRSTTVRRQVLRDVLGFAVAIGLYPKDLMLSPLRGPAGTVDYLSFFTQRDYGCSTIEKLVRKVAPEAPT
jgi:23S rRNA (cytidine1920-2'-O)/16S rRNA (cytidine1409-2'-O)-methyltransferase